MSADIMAWIADEVGLPLLEGVDGVVVRANHAALGLLGEDPTGGRLAPTVARLVGVTPGNAQLADLLERAEAGGPVAGPVGTSGGWRLLAHGPERGRLRVIASPSSLARSAQLERRAAAVDVAAGVSHEVANALSAIMGWAQLGRRQGASQMAETFTLIEDSARAARSAARRLLDAVRSPVEQAAGPMDLGALLDDVVRLLRPEAREKKITIECRVAPDTHVLATSSALFTIVWNLVRNAMEAFEGGGGITISSSVQDETVRLAVADNGPGMDEEQRRRVFDPYFTTKPTGTGLGLAMVKQAVEQLGGRIVLETARGRGTRFVVELPKARTEPNRAERITTDESRRSGVRGRAKSKSPRVLVVEDDRALREMMRTALELQQVDVTAVGLAADALAHGGSFDVALLDLSLPDDRGDRLLAELRRRGVIGAAALVTGVSEPANLDPDGKPDLWLRKPFEPGDLLETIRLLHTFGGSPPGNKAHDSSSR